MIDQGPPRLPAFPLPLNRVGYNCTFWMCDCGLSAGIYNDLGSGSNVDLCVITKDGVEYKRNIEFLQGKMFDRQFPKDFQEHPVTVIKQKQMLTLQDVEVIEAEPEAMDTS